MGQKMKKTQKNKRQQPQNQTKRNNNEQLTFLEHVYELRARIFWVVGALIITSAIGFQFKDMLVSFVMAPLQGEKLVYLTPGGGFSFIFTLCLYFGAILTIPLVVYHLYRFLQPVMGQAPRRLLAGLILLSLLLAMGGAAFGYAVAIPAAIHFLTGFAGSAVTANLTAESYLSFVMAYMFGLAALFQLPLVIFMIDHIRRFPPGTLLSTQRFVIVGAVIAAAIITPTPDVINQMIIAGPIIVVYQLGVVAVWLRRRGARHEEAVEQPQAVAIEEVILPVAKPLAPPPLAVEAAKAPAPAAPTPRRRSIDGFMQPRAGAALPRPLVRPQPSRPLIIPRGHRGLRSIDGFSIV